MENTRPARKKLDHGTHPAARFGATYFLTICCQERGRNQLCRPETGDSVLESARRYHQGGRWWCRIVLLMPDHLHALVGLPAEAALSKVVGDFKHATARFAGIEWQKGFFDHRLRHDESLSEKAAYIRRNPVRAGLISESESWRHSWNAESEFADGEGPPPLPGGASSGRGGTPLPPGAPIP